MAIISINGGPEHKVPEMVEHVMRRLGGDAEPVTFELGKNKQLHVWPDNIATLVISETPLNTARSKLSSSAGKRLPTR